MWTCSKCETKVDPAFDTCWNCGTSREGVEDPSFVKADDAPPIEDSQYDPIAEPVRARWAEAIRDHEGEIVSCYQAYSLMESKFIADQLNGEGIPAMSDTQDLQDALGTMEGNPRVYCREEDLPKARAWIAEYEAHHRPKPDASASG